MGADAELSIAVDAFKRGELDVALSHAQRALAAGPTPSRHHLLGLIHCRQGRPDLGVEPLRLAAEAEPANTAFRVMLHRALIDSGMPEAVLQMPRPPAAPTVAELALWHARAEAAAAVGDHARAAEAWAVLADANGDAEMWINLGRSLLALDRFTEAEAAYEHALVLRPDNVAALLELGLSYERSNRLEELAGLLDAALRAGVAEEQLAFLWALREQRAGNLDAARKHLMTADPAQDPVRWHRLRARIADAAGDAATAFAAAAAMNRATPDFEGWGERAAAYRRDLHALADAMTADWAASLPGAARGDERGPAFLVGFPRSGTTLLDTLLMGHPSLTVIEEKEMLRRAGELVGPLPALPGAPAEALKRARQAYLAELAERTGSGARGVVIDKQPFNMVAAPLIHLLFPGSPIVFVQRHPCDAVLSAFMQSFVPNIGMASFLDLGAAADLYDAAMSVWTAATARLRLNVHRVVYEELVSEPEPQLRSVLEFLGLDWDDRVLDHRATARARGPIMNTSYSQVTEELSRSAIGRWRRYRDQLEPVLHLLLPWAERLGYPS